MPKQEQRRARGIFNQLFQETRNGKRPSSIKPTNVTAKSFTLAELRELESGRRKSTKGDAGIGAGAKRAQRGLDLLSPFKGTVVHNLRLDFQRVLGRSQQFAASRAAKVTASKTSQRNTAAINKLVLSGRKKPRGASVALPKAAGLLNNEQRSLLI